MKKFGTREEVIKANKSERSLFNNNPDKLSLDVNIGIANENTDLAKMYKEVNVNPIKKLEYMQN